VLLLADREPNCHDAVPLNASPNGHSTATPDVEEPVTGFRSYLRGASSILLCCTSSNLTSGGSKYTQPHVRDRSRKCAKNSFDRS
jgi:hypothetical protein